MYVFALAVVLAAALGVAARGLAGLIPGGGNARSDCYIEMDVAGVTVPSSVVRNNKIVDCTDGDACDQGACGDDQCNFGLRPCINQTDPNLPECTPPASLERARIKGRLNVEIPQLLQGSVCGALLDVPVEVKVKRNGTKKPGQLTYTMIAKAPAGTSPRKETDKKAKLRCLPRTAACPPTTTTTTSTTTTTTTTTLPPVCGNGTVDVGEQCDPPCGGGCGAGQLCNGTCQCVAQTACSCGATPVTSFRFNTSIGVGNCGQVTDATGAQLLPLICQGLYIGGGASALPLPILQPDTGVLITNACCSGNEVTLAAATAADTGSNRTCSGIGCLFGAPLPIANTAVPPLSTCVINEVAENAHGSAQCTMGEVDLGLPLTSIVRLAGDLFPPLVGNGVCLGGANDGLSCAMGSDCPGGGCSRDKCVGGDNDTDPCLNDTQCPNGFCSVGVQPCPICAADTTSATGSRCHGGTNDAMPCTPGTTELGPQYPVSHDCPPAQVVLGTLAIPFALTTGTSSLSAPNGQMCTYCRSGGTFADPALPCASSADCPAAFPDCVQRNPGAFASASATTVTQTGTPAGVSLADRMPHAGTVVSSFCIPPTFNGAIDSSSDLAGPGAASFVGSMQLP